MTTETYMTQAVIARAPFNASRGFAFAHSRSLGQDIYIHERLCRVLGITLDDIGAEVEITYAIADPEDPKPYAVAIRFTGLPDWADKYEDLDDYEAAVATRISTQQRRITQMEHRLSKIEKAMEEADNG